MEKKDYSRKKEYRPHDTRRVNDCERQELPETYVIGRNAVRELLGSGRDIDKIFVQSGEREGSIRMLIAEAQRRKLTLVECDRVRLDRMAAGHPHQGIIAVSAERNYASVEDILALAKERGEPPFIILCDGVEDPHNLGAIIRSAECAGAHGVIIPKRRNVGLTPVVAKASAGAIEHVPVAKVTNLSRTIDELKEAGVWFYAADMGDQAYYDTDLCGAVGIVLGSEGDGISHLVKEKCDFTVSIPLYGRLNSLNVSCAAAVLLSEVAKQRHMKKQ